VKPFRQKHEVFVVINCSIKLWLFKQ